MTKNFRAVLWRLLCSGVAAAMLCTCTLTAFAEDGGQAPESSSASSSASSSSAVSSSTPNEPVSSESTTDRTAPTSSGGASSQAGVAKAANSHFQVFVNGKEVTDPETVFTMPKTGMLYFTVISDSSPNLTAGYGSVASTRVSSFYDSGTKKAVFAVVAAGNPGQASGVYIDGVKVFVLRVTDEVYTSSNYQLVTIEKGKSYTFTVTSTNPEDQITFIVGNGSVLSTSAKPATTNSSGQKVYTFSVTGLSAGQTGVYVQVNGVSYLPFDCRVQNSGTSTPTDSSFTCDNTSSVYRTVGHSFTFQVTSSSANAVTFNLGNGSIGRTSVVKTEQANGKTTYTYRIDTQKPGCTGVYVAVNGKSSKVFSIAVGSKADSSGPFWCEQDDAASAAVGSYYDFEVISRSKQISFSVGNGSTASTAVVNTAQENGCTVYTYRLYAKQVGSTSVWISLDGNGYRAFTFTGKEPNTPSEPVMGYINGSSVRLRTEPNTSSTVLAIMNQNMQVQVLDTSNAQWAKIQLSTGVTGYVYKEYLTIGTPSDEAHTSGLSLSNSSGSVPAGKSLYVKATVQPAGNFVSWTSSNPSVATIQSDNNYGYILGHNPGTAVVTASSGNYQASIKVTVTAAEPVRVTYASPNIVSANETATLYAITDISRTGVEFIMDGHTYSAVLQSTKNTNGVQIRVWAAEVSGLTTGQHTYTVQSTTGGSYQSGGGAEVWVSAQTSYTETTQETRRASDKIINFIAEKEGYYATPYRDTLTADQIPTTGYGMVLYPGDTFYNNLSQQEALAGLIDDINENYMPSVNKLRSSQNLWMSQSQADALVSFAYNVGTKYFNSTDNACTFRDVMLNAVVPPSDLSTSHPYHATLTSDTILYSGACGTGSQLQTLTKGSSLQVVDVAEGPSANNTIHKNVWYQVNANGKTGWVSNAYVHLDDSYGLKRDLNYTNANAMGSEFIQWCYSNNTPIKGLYWRRLAEANIYNFNDYDAEKAKSNPYDYTAPVPFQ